MPYSEIGVKHYPLYQTMLYLEDERGEREFDSASDRQHFHQNGCDVSTLSCPREQPALLHSASTAVVDTNIVSDPACSVKVAVVRVAGLEKSI